MITAVVDMLGTWGPSRRVRVTGRTARAVENGIDAAERTPDFEADDIQLVSISGATPDDIGFGGDLEPYDFSYLAFGAPIDVDMVSLDETVPMWHGLGGPWDGWGKPTLPAFVPVRVVCMNTFRMALSAK